MKQASVPVDDEIMKSVSLRKCQQSDSARNQLPKCRRNSSSVKKKSSVRSRSRKFVSFINISDPAGVVDCDHTFLTPEIYPKKKRTSAKEPLIPPADGFIAWKAVLAHLKVKKIPHFLLF